MTRTQKRLLTDGIPHPAASIVDFRARRSFEFPIGNDDEDLVCGACGMVVLAGWSSSSTAERLVVDSQLLIRRGECRAYNVVPTARLAEEPREALAMVHNRLKGLYMRSSSAGAAADCHSGTPPTTTTDWRRHRDRHFRNRLWDVGGNLETQLRAVFRDDGRGFGNESSGI